MEQHYRCWQVPTSLALLAIFVLATHASYDTEFRIAINEYQEAATQWIAINWAEVPEDHIEFFQELGLDLTWVTDLSAEWTVYEAVDVEQANVYMRNLNAILGSEYGAAPDKDSIFEDEDVATAITEHVDKVYGENIGSMHALPEECSEALPFACPLDGLWWLDAIRAPKVWNALPGVVNQNPAVAVMAVDSGIRTTHQDLADNLEPELTVQYLYPQSEPEDIEEEGAEHGTYVAGAIFGAWDNGRESAVGVVGNARGGMCQCGSAYPTFCVLKCISHAIVSNVKVINLSFGSLSKVRLGPDSPYRAAVERFCDGGGLLIASAGNNGSDVLAEGNYVYPAALAADLKDIYPKCVIAVSYVDIKGFLAAESNYGEAVSIAAPGSDILSACAASDTATEKYTGSSLAAAIVSGVATLLFNTFPGACSESVYDCIVTSATHKPKLPYGSTAVIGGGILDLKAAYECMRKRPQCPTLGLPACILPKSGIPVRACGTDNYCQELIDEYMCQYDYADEGTLCKEREHDGHGLYEPATEADADTDDSSDINTKMAIAAQGPTSSSYTVGTAGPADSESQFFKTPSAVSIAQAVPRFNQITAWPVQRRPAARTSRNKHKAETQGAAGPSRSSYAGHGPHPLDRQELLSQRTAVKPAPGETPPTARPVEGQKPRAVPAPAPAPGSVPIATEQVPTMPPNPVYNKLQKPPHASSSTKGPSKTHNKAHADKGFGAGDDRAGSGADAGASVGQHQAGNSSSPDSFWDNPNNHATLQGEPSSHDKDAVYKGAQILSKKHVHKADPGSKGKRQPYKTEGHGKASGRKQGWKELHGTAGDTTSSQPHDTSADRDDYGDASDAGDPAGSSRAVSKGSSKHSGHYRGDSDGEDDDKGQRQHPPQQRKDYGDEDEAQHDGGKQRAAHPPPKKTAVATPDQQPGAGDPGSASKNAPVNKERKQKAYDDGDDGADSKGENADHHDAAAKKKKKRGTSLRECGVCRSGRCVKEERHTCKKKPTYAL